MTPFAKTFDSGFLKLHYFSINHAHKWFLIVQLVFLSGSGRKLLRYNIIHLLKHNLDQSCYEFAKFKPVHFKDFVFINVFVILPTTLKRSGAKTEVEFVVQIRGGGGGQPSC